MLGQGAPTHHAERRGRGRCFGQNNFVVQAEQVRILVKVEVVVRRGQLNLACSGRTRVQAARATTRSDQPRFATRALSAPPGTTERDAGRVAVRIQMPSLATRRQS